MLQVTRDGEVTELIAFDNIVPTGMAVRLVSALRHVALSNPAV